jgi:predicted nucleotidyltransferase
MVAKGKIVSYAQQIAQHFHPEKIILFGSYAYGNPTEDSDVDLLVVMPHEGPGSRKAIEIRLRIHTEFPMDLIVRTPENIHERIRMNDFFIQEIMEKGKILYEANHA